MAAESGRKAHVPGVRHEDEQDRLFFRVFSFSFIVDICSAAHASKLDPAASRSLGEHLCLWISRLDVD